MSQPPPEAPTLLDQIAMQLLPMLRPRLEGRPDAIDTKALFADAYALASVAMTERRNHDHGPLDPWGSWRKVSERFLWLSGWKSDHNGWRPPWDGAECYDNLGDALDAQTDRDDRLAACAACVQLRTDPAIRLHPLPFHTCNVIANPQPAPGPCAKARDADKGKEIEHRMQTRFAGEMKVVDCAACGALSPDSD